MATLALQIAGSAAGGALGGTLGGALGSALGGTLGAMIDRTWLGSGNKITQGPRLSTLSGITANEGAAIPRIYGRVRLGGQVIWATEFEEEQQVEKAAKSGGKSVGGTGSAGGRTVRYTYFANVAIGLCEGPISLLRRVWADGKELDLSTITLRFYRGDDTQEPDPLIVAKQETAEVPAYRGLAYVVFERFPLGEYGNRLPQFSFEVVRAAPGLPENLRAINLIPGSTEFSYAQAEVREDFGYGSSRALNRTQWTHATDWEASLSDLQALAPNLERATLVSAWFGDDLRVEQCTLRPKIEKAGKATIGEAWGAAGLTRAAAAPVSTVDGRPAFGGSPSDASIIAALKDIKARGLKAALHPFILMDIAPGNSLPDPYTGVPGQPAYPWRGRITCTPAPGRQGSVEGSAALQNQLAPFVGQANASHFALSGGVVVYNGPAEWSFRRMVLHHAMLAKAAGGVDTFVLSSELVGLTHCKGSGSSFPFVAALVGLLVELRTILGPACTITYAADWTEYGARVRNGGADVHFPLDTFWAHPEVGAVGIDFYPPLSDWRTGGTHNDAALACHSADVGYLKGNIGAGEAFDFYYVSDAARDAQARTPITDGAFGKPWVYRAKDLKGFWSNAHIERNSGVEQGAPTPFIPFSKPIFLTEIGCPAVSFGGNEPNVFPDPKSSENALPHHSLGARDDLVQRRVIEAYQNRFDPAAAGFNAADNPLSSLYPGHMIDASFIAPWAWDARPYPVFPLQTSLWADGENWLRGHWLNGRVEGVPLRELLRMVARDFAEDTLVVEDIPGFVNGYVLDRPLSLRGALEPLIEIASLDTTLRGGAVHVLCAGGASRVIHADDLIPFPDGTLIEISRRQENELPGHLSLSFVDDEDGFRSRIATSQSGAARSARASAVETALMMPIASARRLVEARLKRVLSHRESWSFRLPLKYLDIEIGDTVVVPASGGATNVVINRIVDAEHRSFEGYPRYSEDREEFPDLDALPPEPGLPALPGAAFAQALELPLPQDGVGRVVFPVRADPWRGPYTILETTSGMVSPVAQAVSAVRVGQTMAPFPAGPLWRWDRNAILDVTLAEGALTTAGTEQVLAGGNALALADESGSIEVVLFRKAELVGQRRYRLSGLLRGLGTSELQANRLLGAGAQVYVLEPALPFVEMGADTLGRLRSFAVLPAGRTVGDATQITLTVQAEGRALRPLSPVHPRARRDGVAMHITFVRRTRVDGDSWETFEVPLGEETERYTIEFLAGEMVRRTVEISAPEYVYTASDEIADFGQAQSVLRVRIRQISRAVGAGDPLAADIPVR